MLLTLDHSAATDPRISGAKAAWLARARQVGLPVLDGVVVPAELSRSAMALAMDVMTRRGSGSARLSITSMSLPDSLAGELEAATDHLPEPMAVRSSSVLEESGEWSGAFTSYLDIRHGELATAVRGCWASTFTVHTLERFAAAEVDPGSSRMAVLVQPALDTDFGGTARISGDEVVVVGVKGSPAPLVQGWEPGAHVRVAPSGRVSGDAGVDLLGAELAIHVAEVLRTAHELIGATSCEWGAVGDDVTLFQLMRSDAVADGELGLPDELGSPLALQVAKGARRAPGPLGEAVVLPWAIAAPDLLDAEAPIHDIDPLDAMAAIHEHAGILTAEVWAQPRPVAMAEAQRTLRALRSADPSEALDRIERLRRPDPERAVLVLGLLARVQRALVDRGAVSRADLAWHADPGAIERILGSDEPPGFRDRIGFDRWEPFDAGVVLSQGNVVAGLPAAPGIAVGRLVFVSDPHDVHDFRSRDVVVGTHPLPNLAALLWDASALVTTGGGPAAHLFESARALGIPAVCGVHLDEALGAPPAELGSPYSIAVDGTSGRIAVMPW